MARFDEKDHDIIKTHSIGNSGYLILRINKKDTDDLEFRSDNYEKDLNDEPNYIIKEKDVVLDIGANLGYFAKTFSRLASKCKVICITLIFLISS